MNHASIIVKAESERTDERESEGRGIIIGGSDKFSVDPKLEVKVKQIQV